MSGNVSRMRVLVVDDSAMILQATTTALTQGGMEVVAAQTASAALRYAETQDFDTIVTDIVMPQMDGIMLTQAIRASSRNSRVPVLFLTSVDEVETIEKALVAGGEDYITKPPRMREMQARVRAAARRYHAIRDLEKAESVLLTLARAVEAKDGTTGSHCERLAHQSVVLGRELGLPEEDLSALKFGGYLHDLGKIGIPDHILLKPGPLTPEEREVMKTHVKIGAALIAPLRTFARTIPIVLYHHERADGGGYPEGLKGDQVPHLAQIFQVVDVFDALVSHRPYKKALSPERAATVLREETARDYWHPKIVETFLRLVENDPDSLALPARENEETGTLDFSIEGLKQLAGL